MALLRPQFSSRLNSSEIIPPISTAQIRNDALLEGFAQGATHWQSLTAMMMGGAVYRIARSAALPLLAQSGLPLFASRGVSSVFALAAEVGAYEGTHRSLSVWSGEGQAGQLLSWSGRGGFLEGFTHSFLNFGVLKMVGAVDFGRSAALQEVSQDLAMILSHRVSEAFGLQARENKTFSEEFLEAACVNLQMRVGQRLGHAFTAGSLQRLEGVAERNYRIRSSDSVARSPRALSPQMSFEVSHAEMEKSLGLNKKWGLRDYQVRMLYKFRADIRNKVANWMGLASPMQTGKSYLTGPAIEMMQREFGNNTRFIILASSKVTTMQIIGDLLTHFKYDEIGRFDAEVKQNDKSITVASVYSLHTNLEKFALKPGEKVVIVNDEAYFTQAPIYRAIYEHFGMGKVQEMDGRMLLGPIENPRGIVLGLSGTGAGLEGYEVSDQLGLMEGITKQWIRDLHGERLILKRKPAATEKTIVSEEDARATISTQEVVEDGEEMIWWEPTLENAIKLREIYNRKIFKGGFKKPLIFVPTIEHGNVLMKAFNGHYGQGFTYFVHSEQKKKKNEDGKVDEREWSREDRDMETVLDRWRNDPRVKTPLISVNQLSRGFRGKGTGAVFHTYQTNSMELFSQRTGRAWAMEPSEPLEELYVLEVAWSRRVEFASLARLLGLLDYPRSEFRTKGIQEVLGKIERKRVLREKMEVEVDMGRIEDIFLSIPILESWRADYDAMVRSVGNVNELSRATGISMEALAGFALGALPTQRWQVEALSPYLGGRDKAIEKWVQVWRDVVDEWFAGGQSLEGKMTEDLSRWINETYPSVTLQSEALEKILLDHFHDAEKPRPPVRRGIYRLMAYIREMYPAEISDSDLHSAIIEERPDFEATLPPRDLWAQILEERLMRRKIVSSIELAERLACSASTINTFEKELLLNFARTLVRKRFIEKGQPLGQASVRYVVNSRTQAAAFESMGFKRVGDLMALSPQDPTIQGSLSMVFRNQLDAEMRKAGTSVGAGREISSDENSPQRKALDVAINLNDVFVAREVSQLREIAEEHDLNYIGDLVQAPMEVFAKLSTDTYLKLLRHLAHYDLSLGMKISWTRPGDRREITSQASYRIMGYEAISLDAWPILQRRGIVYIGDAARLTWAELRSMGLKQEDARAIRQCVNYHYSLGLKLEAWTRPKPVARENKALANLPNALGYGEAYVRQYLKCADLEQLAHYTREDLQARGIPGHTIRSIFNCLHENGYDFGTGAQVRALPFDLDAELGSAAYSWNCSGAPLVRMFKFHRINTWRDLLALSEEDLSRKFPRESHQRQIRLMLATRGYTVGMRSEDFPAPRPQLVEVLWTYPTYDTDGVYTNLFEYRQQRFFERRGWSHVGYVLGGLQGKIPGKLKALDEFPSKLNELGLWLSDYPRGSWKPPVLQDNYEVAAPATMSMEEYFDIPRERLNDLLNHEGMQMPRELNLAGISYSIHTLRDVVSLQEELRLSNPTAMGYLQRHLRDIGFEMKARADYDAELFRPR